MPSATCRARRRRDQGDDARANSPPGSRSRAVDVDVAAAVDDDLVPDGSPRPLRSAWVTSEPSGSRRRTAPPRPDTTSSRPSGSQSMQNGKVDGTRAMTSLSPSRSTAMISCAPQSENHSRPSCQRGDSPNARPLEQDARFGHRNTPGSGHPRWAALTTYTNRTRRFRLTGVVRPCLPAGGHTRLPGRCRPGRGRQAGEPDEHITAVRRRGEPQAHHAACVGRVRDGWQVGQCGRGADAQLEVGAVSAAQRYPGGVIVIGRPMSTQQARARVQVPEVGGGVPVGDAMPWRDFRRSRGARGPDCRLGRRRGTERGGADRDQRLRCHGGARGGRGGRSRAGGGRRRRAGVVVRHHAGHADAACGLPLASVTIRMAISASAAASATPSSTAQRSRRRRGPGVCGSCVPAGAGRRDRLGRCSVAETGVGA